MSDWLDYQQLAASIYMQLAPHALVTHDDKIRGQDTGIERQIDVSIRSRLAGHEMLIIVQSKDQKTPADVNVVGEFKAVIDDVRASKGVLICRSGFTKAALDYSKKLGTIDLCTLHDAQSRKWPLELKIPLLWIEFTADVDLNMELVPDRSNPEPLNLSLDAGKWLTSLDGGKTTRTISQLLTDAWNSGILERTPGKQHSYTFSEPGLQVLLGSTFWCPVQFFTYHYKIHRRGWRGTFTFSQCLGVLNHGTDALTARIAISDRDVPIKRSDSWIEVENVDRVWPELPNIISIEKSMISPDCFKFSVFKFEQP